MRKVVDANYLRHPDLDKYLLSDRQNIAVLTDFACMESYKGDALEVIAKNTEILSRHSNQVEVLKATQHIIALQDTHPSATVDQLVDPKQTTGFAWFCKHVKRAVRGDGRIRTQIMEHGRAASAHFDKARKDAVTLADAISEVTRSFGPAHVRALRTGMPLSPEAAQEMMKLILGVAAEIFASHPLGLTGPQEAKRLLGTYVFRYSLAACSLAARWISVGGAQMVKPDRLANDITDMTYVAYATFFDGLLSKDQKVVEIYDECRFLLDEVFV